MCAGFAQVTLVELRTSYEQGCKSNKNRKQQTQTKQPTNLGQTYPPVSYSAPQPSAGSSFSLLINFFRTPGTSQDKNLLMSCLAEVTFCCHSRDHFVTP